MFETQHHTCRSLRNSITTSMIVSAHSETTDMNSVTLLKIKLKFHFHSDTMTLTVMDRSSSNHLSGKQFHDALRLSPPIHAVLPQMSPCTEHWGPTITDLSFALISCTLKELEVHLEYLPQIRGESISVSPDSIWRNLSNSHVLM